MLLLLVTDVGMASGDEPLSELIKLSEVVRCIRHSSGREPCSFVHKINYVYKK